MIEKMIVIDAGHGGLDSSGNYVTAPDKMFTHETEAFHDGGKFFEGVFNRDMAIRVAHLLNVVGLSCVFSHCGWQDTTLSDRVDLANKINRSFSETIFVSLHANAFNSSVRGLQVHTSIGDTAADLLADMVLGEMKKIPGIMIRQDFSDGDGDYEDNFYVLRKTNCPAILIEFGFFDNLHDALLLINPEMQLTLAAAVASGIVKYYNR